MFHQLMTPVGNSLALSSLVAILPVVTVLLLLGVLRRAAWQAALGGLIVGLIIALYFWQMPAGLAVRSVFNGAVFALWPVMWIVFNGLLLYNVAVQSGRFEAFRGWIITNLPQDRRVILVVIGFCFGALLEGIAGFGTPVAITAALLILLGFPPARSAGVRTDLQHCPGGLRCARGAGDRAGCRDRPARNGAGADGRAAAADHGNHSAVLCHRAVRRLALGARAVADAAGRGRQLCGCSVPGSNFINYTLTDVLSSLGSLITTLLFLKVWHAPSDPEFTIQDTRLAHERRGRRRGTGLAGLAAVDHWCRPS